MGDSAYAPSFRSGQGTSLALVGAYVLAGELAARHDPADAFAAYERLVRPYVEANQALAMRKNDSYFLPRTQEELEARNRVLAKPDKRGPADALARGTEAAYNAIMLPDYGRRE